MNEKYWSVFWHVDATGFIVVKAKSEKEARELAGDEFFPTPENTELGDPIEIVDCVEIAESEYEASK